MKYLHERRKALGGYLPQRRARRTRCPQVPPLDAFEQVLKGSGEGREISTTMAFVRVLTALVRDKELGKRIVPIVPDEARTFGMEGMFRQLGIFASEGQKYEPVDKDQVMFYREDKQGQILEEGINEAGAFSSWIAAATSYSHSNEVTVPFYIFYSMFGIQRIGDLAWAAADQRARGFLLGATAGRTTLNGEGLQHEDGHSHIFSSVVPNCVSYDPTYGYEIAVIIHDGLRRMVTNQEDVYYYITLMNENYEHPALPQGAEPGILKGMYLLRESKVESEARVQLLGSGTILREVIAAAELLEKDWGVAADVWSATSFTELRRDGLAAERWNLLHPEGEAANSLRRRSCSRKSRRAGGRCKRLHEDLRRSDPSLHSEGTRLPRARHRRLRPLRLARQAAPFFRSEPLLRRDRGAQGARRPGRGQGEGRRRCDQEIRHRSRDKRRPNDRIECSQVVVPDIGDFKEVEVIEVLVKPGDAVAKEQSLITLESTRRRWRSRRRRQGWSRRCDQSGRQGLEGLADPDARGKRQRRNRPRARS